MEEVEQVKIEKVFERKVWVESDILGAKHVMIQHDDGEHEPFTYCTFHYGYGYTDNSSVWRSAEKMAIALGAKDPVEQKSRPIPKEWLGTT